MADSVITLKKKSDEEHAEKRVEGFLMRHRVPILAALLVVLVAVVGIIIAIVVADSAKKKGLSAIDSAEFALTRALPDEYTNLDVAARQEEALAALEPYTSKGGVVGVRANMLYADVAFQKKDFATALDAYLDAAKKSRKNYTAPLCYFNAAACAEELGKYEDAAQYYEKAASSGEDFLLVARSLFSLGRVKETLGQYDQAQDAYQQLVDSYSSDPWTEVAQSRLIFLRAKGLVD